MTVGQLRRLIKDVDDGVLIRLEPAGEDWTEWHTLSDVPHIETEQGEYDMPWSNDVTYIYFQMEKEYSDCV